MTQNEIYFECLQQNHNNLRQICKDVCLKNKEQFSEDIFNDTVIQIYNIIQKKGQLDDMSCDGIMRYFVRSYVNNQHCELRYAYKKKRDLNITPEQFNEAHESSLSSKQEKIIKDLREDFSVLYIMKMVELNFDAEHYHLYKLKTLCNKTYSQIHKMTGIKKSREKILEVMNWVRENLSREIIENEFREIYGDLLDY